MEQTPRAAKATPLQVMRAVFWSFFGIRKHAEYQKDAVTLTPAQVITAGLIGALVLVLGLVALVHFIT